MSKLDIKFEIVYDIERLVQINASCFINSNTICGSPLLL